MSEQNQVEEDKAELRQVLTGMGKEVDDAGLDSVMDEIDKDGNGEAEEEEFLVWWKQQDEDAHQAAADAAKAKQAAAEAEAPAADAESSEG